MEIGAILSNTYYILVLLLVVAYYFISINKNAQQVLRGNNTNIVLLFIICLVVVLIIGFRPASREILSDTYGYTRAFLSTSPDDKVFDDGQRGNEWLFRATMIFCRNFTTEQGWLVFIALVYILCAMLAAIILFKNNSYGAMLAFFSGFSTYAYGVNTMRHGMAASILLFAIALCLKSNLRNYVIAAFIAILATKVHNSVTLSIIAFVCAYFYHNLKFGIFVWLGSIIIFLVAGGFISAFMSSLDVDSRLSSYIENSYEYARYNKTGFRLDFVVYSCMPIILGWYVIIKRKLKNRVYEILLCSYIYANSLWITLMTAAHADRFAYLSWYLYPFVMAYPCFAIDVWGVRQGRNGSMIILAMCIFSEFMHFIYYYSSSVKF